MLPIKPSRTSIFCVFEPHGPITPDVPASLLRLANDVAVIADQAALGD